MLLDFSMYLRFGVFPNMFAKLTPNQVPKRGLTDLFVRQLEFELNRSTNWDKKILLPSILEAKSITMSRCFHCYPSCFTQFGLFTVPPPSSTNFLEILVRAQAGDPTALRELSSVFMPQLENFCRLLVSDCNEFKDFAHDAWLKAQAKFSKKEFASEGKFRSWVFMIARNLFLDYLRRKRACDGGESFDPPENNERFSLDEVIRNEEKNRLRECIDKLSEERRTVLVLRYFEYLKYEAIATKLEMPIRTVGTEIHKAKKSLKLCMESKSS
jgi:RNA polymerase sigma-70 factor, ECF subfamily